MLPLEVPTPEAGVFELGPICPFGTICPFVVLVFSVPVLGRPGVAVLALYQSATPITRRTTIIAVAIQYAVVEELSILFFLRRRIIDPLLLLL